MARGRKRYRRINPEHVRLWRARFDAVRERVKGAPASMQLEFADAEHGLERVWLAIDRLLDALEHLALVKPDAGEDADYLVLCEVLAPRLAPYADENHNVARPALLHAAALALDDDLAMFEEFADNNDALRFAEDTADEAAESLQRSEHEAAAASAHLLASLDGLRGKELGEDVQAALHRLVRLGIDDAELAPGARQMRAQILNRVMRLLGSALQASGQLPD